MSAVSGATYSSRGILEAVADALKLDTSLLPEVPDAGRSRGKRNSAGRPQGEKGSAGSTPSPDGTGDSSRKRGTKAGSTEQNEGSAGSRQGGSRNGQSKNKKGSRQDRTGPSGKARPNSQAAASPEPSPSAPAASSEPSSSAPAASSGATFKDGEYTGTGKGYRGATNVRVTVENGQISDITVISFDDDTKYFSRARSSLIPAILKAQGIDVKAVSGATFSSNGILEAVADALDIEFANPNPSAGGRRKGRR